MSFISSLRFVNDGENLFWMENDLIYMMHVLKSRFRK